MSIDNRRIAGVVPLNGTSSVTQSQVPKLINMNISFSASMFVSSFSCAIRVARCNLGNIVTGALGDQIVIIRRHCAETWCPTTKRPRSWLRNTQSAFGCCAMRSCP